MILNEQTHGDSFPVSDPELDAPDGAIVDGYERIGDMWVRLEGDELVEAEARAHAMETGAIL